MKVFRRISPFKNNPCFWVIFILFLFHSVITFGSVTGARLSFLDNDRVSQNCSAELAKFKKMNPISLSQYAGPEKDLDIAITTWINAFEALLAREEMDNPLPFSFSYNYPYLKKWEQIIRARGTQIGVLPLSYLDENPGFEAPFIVQPSEGESDSIQYQPSFIWMNVFHFQLHPYLSFVGAAVEIMLETMMRGNSLSSGASIVKEILSESEGGRKTLENFKKINGEIDRNISLVIAAVYSAFAPFDFYKLIRDKEPWVRNIDFEELMEIKRREGDEAVKDSLLESIAEPFELEPRDIANVLQAFIDSNLVEVWDLPMIDGFRRNSNSKPLKPSMKIYWNESRNTILRVLKIGQNYWTTENQEDQTYFVRSNQRSVTNKTKISDPLSNNYLMFERWKKSSENNWVKMSPSDKNPAQKLTIKMQKIGRTSHGAELLNWVSISISELIFNSSKGIYIGMANGDAATGYEDVNVEISAEIVENR